MRYLDDYLALWSHAREKLEEFLKFVNQIDAKIQFTMEVEDGERLPFLDVEVVRFNGTLKKKLYQRSPMQVIILNFRSHHNYRLKIGIMRSMIIRSLRLTDAEFWEDELDKLTRILLGNGYPIEVIQSSIRSMKSRWQNGDYERTERTMNEGEINTFHKFTNWIFMSLVSIMRQLLTEIYWRNRETN
ncbi:unnamed protein product [Protopolystoma xenopodis]|uniref:Helix-turn-helix domain-containing protein n=1 Tax=Protopolystoma xenopodis TaxID=117903 RepID=A0A3S5BD89_9PLAT|nr:unnamed protein product [Protopolystoma xenopodis]